MASFSEEMLRCLQPELLQPDEMKEVLIKRGVPSVKLSKIDKHALLEIFKNTAVPKPRRNKRNDSSRTIIKSKTERSSGNSASNGRRISWTDSAEKSRTAESNHLKPPSHSPKSSSPLTTSYSEKSQTSCRLKPPPDLSQPQQKKIKLNRSSSETLDSIIVNDRSKIDSSKLHSEMKLVSPNGHSDKNSEETRDDSNHTGKKVALIRGFSSSQSSTNSSNEAVPVKKKKISITWP